MGNVSRRTNEARKARRLVWLCSKAPGMAHAEMAGDLTRREHVLVALAEARQLQQYATPTGVMAAPDGWVGGPALTAPWCGGSEGLRRLREARELGYEIEMRRQVVNGKKTNTREYRLVDWP